MCWTELNTHLSLWRKVRTLGSSLCCTVRKQRKKKTTDFELVLKYVRLFLWQIPSDLSQFIKLIKVHGDIQCEESGKCIPSLCGKLLFQVQEWVYNKGRDRSLRPSLQSISRKVRGRKGISKL